MLLLLLLLLLLRLLAALQFKACSELEMRACLVAQLGVRCTWVLLLPTPRSRANNSAGVDLTSSRTLMSI
jgi:hypothetical protein